MKTHLLTLTVACAAATGVAVPANAADYPTKPIKIIVPYAPGGGTDQFSRTIADFLSKRFNESVIVENKAGANTLIGNQAIASSAPDGYTFGMISSATTSLPATMKGFNINPVKDFSPITQLVTGDYAFVVSTAVPVRSVGELITYIKANPDKLNFASSGGSNDLVISLFKTKSGTNIPTISYKGIAPARQALLANEVQITLEAVGVAKDLAAAGRMKFLAVTGARRDPFVPDIPTVSENGLEGFSADFWWGYGGPAGMSSDIVKKLHDGIIDAMKTQALQNQIKANGNIPVGNSPEEFARIIANDVATWTAAARAAGITPQ